ncbi:MAG: hypothetical protein ACI4J2_04460 [Ruminococcus sp.]
MAVSEHNPRIFSIHIMAVSLCLLLLAGGCEKSADTDRQSVSSEAAFSTEQMNRELLDAVDSLTASSTLYFKYGLEITGLGVTFDGRPGTLTASIISRQLKK